MIYDDAQDALAAEYVLGTLSGDEREHAEALLTIDPGFAASVRQWERRLGELNVMVEAVEPPPELWDKIKGEVGGPTPTPEAAPSPEAARPVVPSPLTAAPPVAQPPAVPPPAPASPPAEASPPVEPSRPEPATELPPMVTAAEDTFASLASLIPQEAHERAAEAPKSATSSAPTLSESVSDSIAAALKKSFAEPPDLGDMEEDLADFAPTPVPEPRIDNTAEVIYLSRRVRRWRRMTAALAAFAAVLALYVAFSDFEPGLIGFRGDGSTGAARLVAVLQQEPTAPAFLLTVDPLARTLVVRRVSAMPEQGRSYELWLIARGYPTPRSLGVIGNDEFTERSIPGDFDIGTLRSASYAVSLEPAGGSPSGVPTGPVLFTGTIVDAEPASLTPRT
jgi:anti-sigma-K factor RskA